MRNESLDAARSTKRTAVAAPRGAQTRQFWMLVVILGVCAARMIVLTLDYAPLHFDEAQYWSYGEALDFGYYSKPPMAAWLIRISTDIFGDTEFGVRFFAPWIHGLIAWLIFVSARRLFDAETGFWAGLAYLTLPAVTVSSTIMSTDPPMMAAWAAALYALIRVAEPHAEAEGAAQVRSARGDRLLWWALLGAAIGAGLNAKYTIIAFAGGAIGYALFSHRAAITRGARSFAGPAAAIAAALIVWAPNLIWNAAHDFASIAHVADNAKMGGGPEFNFDKMAEFVGAQFAIFGPILGIAALMLIFGGRWRRDWRYRLLMWVCLPLLGAMIVQSFLSRAHPNWAAPAYIALSVAVAAWLLDQGLRRWLIASAALGAVVFIGFTSLALLYRESPTSLPRVYDPYKKLRPEALICAEATPYLRPEEKILSSSRRLLAVCMFQAGRGMDEIRIPRAGPAGNHYQLAAPLTDADTGPMLMVMETTSLEGFAARFDTFEPLETGVIQTHGAREGRTPRTHPYAIARVSGYRGAEAEAE